MKSMASWKLDGVVPDSEDEGSFDSQTHASVADVDEGDESHCNDLLEYEPNTRRRDAAEPSCEKPTIQTVHEFDKHTSRDPDANTAESWKPHPRTLPTSSPTLPPVFQVPQPLWELDLECIDTESYGTGSRTNAPITGPLPSADDISKTYVRLISPGPSELLSFTSTQQDDIPNLPPAESFNNGDIRASSTVLGSVDGPRSYAEQEPARSYKRSLRERAPIQLHPYAMEQEKYRRTLKSRGIAPMRIAQTQDEDDQRRTFVSSSDPISQKTDSQDREQETEESAPMDCAWDSRSMSTERNAGRQSPLSPKNCGSALASDDDDEFPDLDDLLRTKPLTLTRTERNPHVNTRTSKGNRPQSSIVQTSKTRLRMLKHDPIDILDVPASPPATSSPFPTTIRSGRRAVLGGISISSKESTPSWVEEHELASQLTLDLPTPVTSATKPISESMVLGSDLDDDPFASEAPEEAVGSLASSSSDESIQIREVRKKIRGVLPASHLRLDQQLAKLKHPSRGQRDIFTASPEKLLNRRGIALPKVASATYLGLTSTMNGLPSISDDSADDERNRGGSIAEDDSLADVMIGFDHNRMGFAEEENKIDAMLPPLKRQGIARKKSRKRLRVGSASLPTGYQTRITEQLVKRALSTKQSRRQTKDWKLPRKKTIGQERRPKPARLSILDIFDAARLADGDTPLFIKVAARTARSQVGQGRQSPSKKFIRLASDEDTLDAQLVLEDWRRGKILPRIPLAATVSSTFPSRPPLGGIADNQQTLLQPQSAKVVPRNLSIKHGLGHLDKPRQLVVSVKRQTSIKSYASTQQSVFLQRDMDPIQVSKADLHLLKRRTARTHSAATVSRPAQLESSDLATSYRNLTAAFKKTKQELDARFRLSGKHPNQEQKHIQLNRFLADSDVVRDSPGLTPLHEARVPVSDTSKLPEQMIVLKRRKNLPQRIDIGAAKYRQPSEPLVLGVLNPADCESVMSNGHKLMGLGKYGTQYPAHFDIYPLQPGTFFHESTFVGNGLLAEAVKPPTNPTCGTARGQASFRLGDKEFQWASWNEDVSSEIGLFFDCLVGMLSQLSPSQNPADSTPAAYMEFLITYIQYTVSFANSASRHEFLSRMLETLQDFVSRVSEASGVVGEKAQYWIDTMTRCCVLVLQLLLLSRAVQAQTSVAFEDLLRRVSSMCTRFLVQKGLDVLRKLYDDIQYLSFRERGIRTDNYCAVAWVIVLKVLDASRIPKASFWDITNMVLVEGNSKLDNDAREMEQVWYSVFSLLPLCEFDDFGVAVSGLRYRRSFDNWAMPQRLLGSVFVLYTSDAKQYPGFNDYFRVLIMRCHYLMKDWGWWRCGGMIGSIFDFFASQKLGHLRNEEAYKSPHFLEQLDAGPSLDVEPEDRSFHIFLKFTALAIKNMRRQGNEKSVRNLVARLLPNHDRQYPKDEAIQTRDLAALRNHHDLLCTLYWASPSHCRPALSIIQDLINADHSHKEACLINLRAMDNLGRYIFTSPADESPVYKQFSNWELTFFNKILRQYLGAESEVLSLAEQLTNSNGLLVPETQVRKTVDANRKSSMNTIRTLMFNLRERIKTGKDAEAILSALNAELLSKILHPGIFDVYQDINEGLIGDAIDSLQNYMDRADVLHPFRSQHTSSHTVEIDSQGSLDLADLDIERQMIIYPLHEVILPTFAPTIKGILESRLCERTEPLFMENLVLCWARLVSFVTEEKHDLREFVANGANAVFENRQRSARATKYWPLFLSQLLEGKSVAELKAIGLSLDLEWMHVITSNPTLLTYEPNLSKRLSHQKYYLLEQEEWPIHENWPKRHLHMFQVALNTMRVIKLDSKHGDLADNSLVSEREIQNFFSYILRSTMDSMQRQLVAMMPQSNAHIEYVKFCQETISHVRAYASGIRPITDFFLQHSQHYWPKSDDPHLYAAGIVSYSLRLHSQRGKASLELFHYLYSGWKSDQMHSRVQSHVGCVLKGMRNWAFAEFMLTNFVPATILTGFRTVAGSVLAETYLPILARRSQRFLQRSSSEGSSTFLHLVNILKIIINCIRVTIQTARHEFGHDHEVSSGHGRMISISCHFWLSIQPALMEYVDVHPTKKQTLDEIESLLNALFPEVAFYLGISRDRGISTEEQQVYEMGEYVERFATALQDDIEKYWILIGTSSDHCADHSLIVKVKTGARDGGSINLQLSSSTIPFTEVLELWKSFYGGITQESLNRQLDRTESGLRLPQWMMAEQVTKFPGVYRGIF